MIDGLAHCERRLLHLPPHEFRIVQFGIVAPAKRFLPHHKPHFVAQIKEILRLRIVRTAHVVATDRLHELNIAIPDLPVGGIAELGVRLMAVNAEQANLLSVQIELLAAGLDLADAKTDSGRTEISGPHGNRVQIRRSTSGTTGPLQVHTHP